MNSGLPWPKSTTMFCSQPGMFAALKLATVVGSSSKDDAKIGGMTPATLILSGRCEDSPPKTRFPRRALDSELGRSRQQPDREKKKKKKKEKRSKKRESRKKAGGARRPP